MEKTFLKDLYFELFTSTEEEKRLMNIHDFPDEKENVRNDQRITAERQKQEILNRLIDRYIKTT